MRVVALLALAGCWHGSAPTEAPAEAPTAPVVASALPREPDEPCRGTNLRIGDVQKHCAQRVAEQVIPAAISIELDPPRVALDGGTTRNTAIVLTNGSRQDVDVVLDNACDVASEVSSVIVDANGDRVDVTGPQCGGGRGCSGSTVRFTLRPAGSLRIPFVVDGRLSTFDANCVEQRVGAVPSGQYRLLIYSSVKEFDVPITVY